MKQLKHSQGFTFIEVLIALIVVAIALAATTAASSTAISNTGHLRDKTMAHWVAENRLTEIRIGQLFPDIGDESTDSVDMGQGLWTWKQKVEKNGNNDKDFRRITIYVYKGEELDSDSRPITFLSTVITAPAHKTKGADQATTQEQAQAQDR